MLPSPCGAAEKAIPGKLAKMHGQAAGEVEPIVSPERALESLSVDKSWHLLSTLSSQVTGKQTELQLMVGSRYHELIESADSIVSMKEIGSEVLGLLRDFPQVCSTVLEQAPTLSWPTKSLHEKIVAADQDETTKKNISEVTQLMLHAPAAMWAALDSNKVLEAAQVISRCRASWALASKSLPADVDSSLAAFLRSHVTYVEQFPERIVSASRRLLTRFLRTEETAGALGALLQLHAFQEPDPLRCLLELLLRRRGGAVMAMLAQASRKNSAQAQSGADVEGALWNTVTALQKTIVDVHVMFAPSEADGSCMLTKLAYSTISSPSIARRKHRNLRAGDIKRMCTEWLGVLVPKVRASSEHLLRAAANDTNMLARIRGILWKVTHCEGTAEVLATGARSDVHDEAFNKATWVEAVLFTIDTSTVEGGVNTRGLGEYASPLDLWSLLFSKIFTDLAEALLAESLRCVRHEVECRLDSILLAVTGSQSAQSRGNVLLENRRESSHALMAHDILAAADAVVSLLMSELRSLADDAWCLTERDDKVAADALRTSFYLLSVETAAGLANHLRVALQEIRSCIESAAKQMGKGYLFGGGNIAFGHAIGSLADAGLVIGRVAWMLTGRSGRPLQSALTSPECSTQESRGRIEEQQLEAAFVIADTDGDGVVDTEEAAEALQAISFGASAALVLDPTPYQSFTLSEFFLFATRLLEDQRPLQHLRFCFDELLAESLTVWAERSLDQTAAFLREGCSEMAKLCHQPNMTDDLWRQAHGLWEMKTIDLDRDTGDGVQETVHFPIMVSPAVLCYVEGVAAELSRVLSTVDFAEADPTECHRAGEHEKTHSTRYGKREAGKASRGRGTEQGTAGYGQYARSLAAVRASADLKKEFTALCEGPESAATNACEAAQLQILLDTLFLQKWVVDREEMTSSMSRIVETLCDLVDPINLQIYMPHLQAAASACSAACCTSLSLIFEQQAGDDSEVSSFSMSPDGALASSSSFIALVPKARRFEILPLPLESVPSQHPTGLTRARIAPGHQPGVSAVVDETGVSAQARGMEVGRQALAGLMDQVGSVGSVLSAQNVNVQSVFGAASLFLGGRNRRGDADDDRGY